MRGLDWILLCFGFSGWALQLVSVNFYAKAFHSLSKETIEMLKEQQEATLEHLKGIECRNQ